MSIRVQKLDHVALDVRDVEKAALFYGKLLGLQEIPRPESFDFPGLWYDLGNIILHVVGPRKPALGSHHIAFWVDDVHACAEEVLKACFEVKWDSYKIQVSIVSLRQIQKEIVSRFRERRKIQTSSRGISHHRFPNYPFSGYTVEALVVVARSLQCLTTPHPRSTVESRFVCM